MIPTSTAVFITNGMILKKSRGLWIRPSQATQLKLLDRWHGKSIADRTLRYHHLNHTRAGLTYRQRQWKRNADGTVYSLTTKMCYTVAGYQDLVNMGHAWAKFKIKTLIQKYGAKSDSAKKPDPVKSPTVEESPPRKPGENPFEDPEFRQSRGMAPFPLWKKQEY